ncbi:MAG: STAS/SEC14 domain-containing protein [Myxococcota bacterium]
MLERLKDLPPGIVGVIASGTVTQKDYETTFVPMLDEARAQGERLRFIYRFAPDFEGFSPSGAWEDVRLGLRAMRLFDGCAVLTDIGWIRESTRLAGFFLPCPVRAFSGAELAEAVEWLGTLSASTGVTHRLVPGSGIIVVEASAAVSAQALDSLAFTADAWIEAHGALQGLVIHAREFPGWADFGSLLRHVRFIRDHHQKIGRVALVSDSELSNVAPRVAEHFLSAEIEGFPYDELEDAIAWVHAGASVEPRALASVA